MTTNTPICSNSNTACGRQDALEEDAARSMSTCRALAKNTDVRRHADAAQDSFGRDKDLLAPLVTSGFFQDVLVSALEALGEEGAVCVCRSSQRAGAQRCDDISSY